MCSGSSAVICRIARLAPGCKADYSSQSRHSTLFNSQVLEAGSGAHGHRTSTIPQ